MQFVYNKGTIQEQAYAAVYYRGEKYMKPTLAYLFMVADSIQDKLTNKWTHVNQFNLLIIPKNSDHLLTNFRVVGQINNVQDGPSVTEIRIVDKQEKTIESSVLRGTLVKGDVQFSAMFLLAKFDTPGRYYLRAYTDGKKLMDGNKYYFEVTKADA